MSWLSPRRRRTTGNLKNIPNGQYKPILDNAAGLIIPSRLESTGEESLSIARRLSESQVRDQGNNGKLNLAQTVEEFEGTAGRLKDVEEQEPETDEVRRDGQRNGHANVHGIEQQLGHITALLNTLNDRLGQIQQVIEDGNRQHVKSSRRVGRGSRSISSL